MARRAFALHNAFYTMWIEPSLEGETLASRVGIEEHEQTADGQRLLRADLALTRRLDSDTAINRLIIVVTCSW